MRAPAIQSMLRAEWCTAWNRQSHGHAMKRAVHPVLHEVGEEHDRDELHEERQRADPRPQPPSAARPRGSVLAGTNVRYVRTWTSRLLTRK